MELDKLATALVKAQKEMKEAKKDSANPFFSSRYASLASVWEACHDALTSNGLSVIQSPTFKEGKFFLTTTLLHVSGQSISGEYLVSPEKSTPQGFGSAYSYAKRYSLAGMVGVVSIDEDDDAEAATDHNKSKTVAEPKRKDGALTIAVVKKLKTGTSTNGKEWNLWLVVDSEKREYTTFEDSLAAHAESKRKTGEAVKIVSEPGNKEGTVTIKDIQTLVTA